MKLQVEHKPSNGIHISKVAKLGWELGTFSHPSSVGLMKICKSMASDQ
jgi:hypothetical protein